MTENLYKFIDNLPDDYE